MFVMTNIPQTPPTQPGSVGYWPSQPQLSDLLSAIRVSNDILRSIDAILRDALNGAKPVATKPDPDLTERVAWLERQIAELKERR